MVEDLISADVASADSFDWVRHVRHYWDGENDALYVAFAQVRAEGIAGEGELQWLALTLLPSSMLLYQPHFPVLPHRAALTYSRTNSQAPLPSPSSPT